MFASGQRCPLRHRHTMWPWFLVASAAVPVMWLLAPAPFDSTELLAAALSGLWGVCFFFHRSHAENARFMKELLEYFNKRYDDQNNDLQKLLRKEGELDEVSRLAFIDYFNLCAEEWVFREAGYIYDPVWDSWINGMRQYARDPRVAELWRKENQTDSYYGFDLLDQTKGKTKE